MQNTFLTKSISQSIVDIIPHFLFSFSSIHTRRAYMNDLKNFCNFLSVASPTCCTLDAIDESLILRWKEYLEKEEKLDSDSVRRKLNCLSSLFAFAQKRKLIEINPTQWIKRPRQKNISKTNELNPEEMKKIFHHLEKKIETLKMNETQFHQSKRTLQSLELQYAVLKLLCGTGLRVSELCHLKLKDIEIQSDRMGEKKFILHIQKAKGEKEHKVFLAKSVAEVLLAYKKNYKNNMQPANFFFTRVQSSKDATYTPLSTWTIHTMLTKNALEVGITKKVSPHSIRSGVATLLHTKGVPLARIQSQLGHADVATTSLYIKKSNEIEESAALQLDLEEETKPCPF